MSSRLMNHVRALQEEIGVLKDRIQPHDTGHIHTTIDTLEDRVKEINEELERNKLDDEPTQIVNTTTGRALLYDLLQKICHLN